MLVFALLIVPCVIAVVSGDAPSPPPPVPGSCPPTPAPPTVDISTFQGETDPCDSSTDIEFLKKVCNKTASLLGCLNPPDTSLTFTDQYPACKNVKIQTQSCQGAQQQDMSILFCLTADLSIWIGKGQSTNGVFQYSCEDTSCYPQVPNGDVPNVFSGKNQIA